jgi:integral membrane protein (TIGR01906 family)
VKNYTFLNFLSWLVTLVVIVVVVLSGVRLLLTPLFVNVEYNMPGFPADYYGFTKSDRLYWSKIALNYLLNNAGISYLGDLRFDNGDPVYNERELQHMVDVKRVVQATLAVWYAALAFLLGIGVWAWRGGWWNIYRNGLARGGWFTVSLLVLIIFFVLFSFNTFFVTFHSVFFQPGTWQFEFSDTLIRLFPERFWQDAFIMIGGIAIILGLALGFGFRTKLR